jgi:hypothetical protein
MNVEGLRAAVGELVEAIQAVAEPMGRLAQTLGEAATLQPASLPMYAREIIASVGPTHADRVAWARDRAYQGLTRELVIVLLFAPFGSWDALAWALLRGYVPDSALEEWLLSSDAAGKNAAFFAARLVLLDYKLPLPHRVDGALLAPTHALMALSARLAARDLRWLHGPHSSFSIYLHNGLVAQGRIRAWSPDAPPIIDIKDGPWALAIPSDGLAVYAWRRFCEAARSMPPVLAKSYDPSRVAEELYSGLGLGWAEMALDEARAAHNNGGKDETARGVGVGVLGSEGGGEV